MDLISLALTFFLKNPEITTEGLRQATKPGMINTERMASSFADLSREVLRCYHKSARFKDANILEQPWQRQAQYGADNSAVIRVRFSGVSGLSYEIIFAVLLKQGMVRTAIIGDSAMIPYNKNCQLENWVGTPSSPAPKRESAPNQVQRQAVRLSPANVQDEIARDYRCTPYVAPERDIKSLVEKNLIWPKPYQITDAIHYYAAKPGTTAFGLPLVAVYPESVIQSHDDCIFR